MGPKTPKILHNSFAAILQIVLVGIIYLVLYKYILKTIGIELLGVWSLIIATTSVALIANFGLSTSIIKFVAVYHARSDTEGLRKLIFTSSVFIICTYVSISIILLMTGHFLLSLFIDEKYLAVALDILPFSLISLVINALGGVVSSSLEGIQKNYIRSYIISISSIILLVISLMITPIYGLKGLVMAQIAQATFVLLISLLYVNIHIPETLSFKWRWSKPIFREIISYGLKMQALSLMQLTFEPVTKALLSKFGGLAMVGYYEMASRLVGQFRGVLVSANQVLIPVIAQAKENNENQVREIYIKSFTVFFIFNVLIISSIIIASPLISYLWIGEIIQIFIFAVIVNSIVAFINICSNPAYFSYLGEGQLKWPLYQYVVMTILNGLLGYTFGLFYGGYGVIASWNFAFAIGSLIILLSYHRQHKIKFREVLNGNDYILLAISSAMAVSGYYTIINYINAAQNYWVIVIFIISLALFFIWLIKNKSLLLIISQIKRIR